MSGELDGKRLERVLKKFGIKMEEWSEASLAYQLRLLEEQVS